LSSKEQNGGLGAGVSGPWVVTQFEQKEPPTQFYICLSRAKLSG